MENGGDQRKKLRGYMLLFGAMMLVIATFAGIIAFLFIAQNDHYKGDFTKFNNKWIKDGMADDSLRQSILIFDFVILACFLAAILILIMFGALISVSYLSDGLIMGGVDVNNALYNVFVAIYIAFPLLIMTIQIYSNFLPLCLVLGIILPLLYFLQAKLKNTELMIYGLLIVIPLSIASTGLLGSEIHFSAKKATNLNDYKEFGQELKGKIIKYAKEVGMTPDSIYIRHKNVFNAYSTSGVRFKNIVLFEGLVKAMNDDQILSVFLHEVGHIASYHPLKAQLYFPFCLLLIAGGLIFIHRKLLKCYNELTSVITLLFLYSTAVAGLAALGNSAYIYPCEYDADCYAFKGKGYGESLREALKILAISSRDGKFYDYEWWISPVFNHPSTCKRIGRINNFIAGNK